jgi:hypothetical protein
LSGVRWTEERIDDLADRVNDVENELGPVRALPNLVAQHERRLDRMRDDELRRVTGLHTRLDRLEERLNARLDAAAGVAAKKVEDSLTVNWRSVGSTLLAAGVGVGTPIAAALILAPG